MKKLLTILTLMLLIVGTADAQITIPNTFSPNTVAQSALVNANFSQLGALALNRAGGNLTGNLTADGGVTIDGIDIGATICTTCDPTFDDVTVDTLTAVSATFSSTGAAAIDVAGGITAGTGNVGIVDTTGKIPAISSTFFASLSGANLTGLLEAAITDGTILARVAANETISGTWAFSNPVRVADGDQSAPSLSFSSDTNTGIYLASPDVLTIATGGLAHAGWIENGNFRHNRGLEFGSTISPTALSTGNNNNYNPTGLSTAFFIRLDGGAGSPTLTGITARPTGTLIVLCRVAGSGITIANEDANSTAANRFIVSGGSMTLISVADGDCATFIYDGTSARWRNISVTQ